MSDIMYTEIKTITPEVAAQYLQKAAPNRPVKYSFLKRYVEDMKAGKWVLSPQPICFDTNGQLVNGKHRMTAVVTSGVTCSFCVTYNVPIETHMVLDTGAKRTAFDQFCINYADLNIPSSYVKTAIAMNHGNLTAQRRLSESLLYEYIHKHKAAIDNASIILTKKASKLNTPYCAGVVARCWYQCNENIGIWEDSIAKSAKSKASFDRFFKGYSLERLNDFIYLVMTPKEVRIRETANYISCEENVDILKNVLATRKLTDPQKYFIIERGIEAFMEREQLTQYKVKLSEEKFSFSLEKFLIPADI